MQVPIKPRPETREDLLRTIRELEQQLKIMLNVSDVKLIVAIDDLELI